MRLPVRALARALLSFEEALSRRVARALDRLGTRGSAAVRETAHDTIYALDRVGEQGLARLLRPLARLAPFVLVAEGVEDPILRVHPRGTREGRAPLRLLLDPVDGTRGFMYGKRSAWVVAALAPNRGEATRLRDAFLSAVTEIPLPKMGAFDRLWAVRGRGALAERVRRRGGAATRFRPRPSRARSLLGGFAQIARFHPGGKEVLAAIEEEVFAASLGPSPPGHTPVFEDQYLCTAGQMMDLATGKDRFTADLRASLSAWLARRGGRPLPHACRPYDAAGALVAAEAGVILADAAGRPLDAPFDASASLDWAGYANGSIRRLVEPHLRRALERRGIIRRGPGGGA